MGGKWNYWEGVFGELDFRVHSGPEFWTVADFRGCLAWVFHSL
jgi:hypothetical protein